jgi:hypothetical protein
MLSNADHAEVHGIAGDPRSIFQKRYTEMITRVSLDLISYQNDGKGCAAVRGSSPANRE